MRLQWLALLGILILLSPAAGMAADQEQDGIPPEKIGLIYETLLPPEENLAGEVKETVSAAEEQNRAGAERIARMLEKQGIKLNGWPGLWEFQYEGRKVFLLIASAHNQLRLITPVADMQQLRAGKDFDEAKVFGKLLKANYLMTQEAHFALNREVIWLCYSHPLDSVTERDVMGALNRLTAVAAETSEGGDSSKKEPAESKRLVPFAQ